jgi:hypothetical protein
MMATRESGNNLQKRGNKSVPALMLIKIFLEIELLRGWHISIGTKAIRVVNACNINDWNISAIP